MAVFKSLPNYEYSRPGIYAHFNGEGFYETKDVDQIAILENCKPFIQRVDKVEVNAAPPKPKPEPKKKGETKEKPKPKAPATKKK